MPISRLPQRMRPRNPADRHPIVGPTLDNGRSKPDIVAPGTVISLTAPYVTGAAAVLVQAGARGDGGTNTIIGNDSEVSVGQ